MSWNSQISGEGLNKKTGANKHPLQRIQLALDNLGGSKWFSVLDQSRVILH